MKKYNKRRKKFEKIKSQNEDKSNEEKSDEDNTKKTPISNNIDENISTIKDTLKDCDDVIYREFLVGIEQKHKFAIIYTDGLTDKALVSNFVLESLMHQARELPPDIENIKKGLYELVDKGNVTITELKEAENLDEAIENVLIGETILLVDGFEKIMVVSSRGWPIRGVSEPQTETVIRGPRDGFVETGKVNTTLVRRRIRDPKLKLKYMQVGERSKTDVAVMYIEDIADKKLVDEVNKRLKNIKIDAVLESSYIEQLIEDNWLSPFPQVESTERPDSVAAALYEGRVAMIIDNTPFALIAPVTLNILMQSSEDYYDRWFIASIIRITRYVAAFFALLLPSLYIAITSYHPGMLPTQLALYVAATRMGVPFPAFIEAFIMEATIELLRESGTRISGPIGTTIGIVGGLVIGQAAVEAGIVSPLMVIIVAVTTISSFALPNYSFATGFRIVRFLVMISAAVLGLYGIMLSLVVLGAHLVSLRSFGVPFTSPYSSFSSNRYDLKDTIIKAPLRFMRKRPRFSNFGDKIRLNNGAKEEGDDKDDAAK